MITIHGIKSCGSVKKALNFLKEHNIVYSFRDFKTTPASCDEIQNWLKNATLTQLLNTKGTTYKKLQLKELNLDDKGKEAWLCKESMLIKRPVLEYPEGVLIGYDEEIYKGALL